MIHSRDRETLTLSPLSEISGYIWQTRYRHERCDGSREQSLDETLDRVATAIAAAEPRARELWRKRFCWLLHDFRFLPGGRILAGAGTGLHVTLCNCFVMGVIEDDVQGIFDSLKEAALTMQAGGGVGCDFSTLRPAGSRARTSGRIASGPVSFLQVFNSMCATLLSTGLRRGAMLASLRCDHPDIEAFIDAKKTPGALEYFNLSVQLSDDFMQAVANDADWPLLFPSAALARQTGEGELPRSWPGFSKPVNCTVLRRVPARQLWERLMTAAYTVAEPGVLFVDRINAFNNLYYREQISTSNPCGEIPLPAYGACNLGSINLPRFVRAPFCSGDSSGGSPEASFDFSGLARTARLATRFLDNVIDQSLFPLPAQAVQARGSRRIGLGITGLADALIMLGLHYDSKAARQLAARIMQCLCLSAYRASTALAAEKGSFPWFDKEQYLRSRFIASLPAAMRRDIAARGIRNSHLLAIAPCGTISLLADNISSGIEPVFDFHMQRRVRDCDGGLRLFSLTDHAFAQWQRQQGGDADPPAWFVSGRELSPLSQLKMQAALQRYVDNSISKTVTVAPGCSFEEFRDLFTRAYQYGLKGCTVFRPNPLRGEILSHPAQAGCLNLHCEDDGILHSGQAAG